MTRSGGASRVTSDSDLPLRGGSGEHGEHGEHAEQGFRVIAVARAAQGPTSNRAVTARIASLSIPTTSSRPSSCSRSAHPPSLARWQRLPPTTSPVLEDYYRGLAITTLGRVIGSSPRRGHALRGVMTRRPRGSRPRRGRRRGSRGPPPAPTRLAAGTQARRGGGAGAPGPPPRRPREGATEGRA